MWMCEEMYMPMHNAGKMMYYVLNTASAVAIVLAGLKKVFSKFLT